MLNPNNGQLSAEEAQRYDRQIRIWGFSAQKKIQSTRCLIIGVNHLSTEIAKNLALTGVQSICVFDETLLTYRDVSRYFFLGPDDVDRMACEALGDYLRSLNNLVKVTTETDTCRLFDLVSESDVVCCTSLLSGMRNLIGLNEKCRLSKVPFLLAFTYRHFGILFQDAGDSYSFARENADHKQSNQAASANFDPNKFTEATIRFDSLDYLSREFYSQNSTKHPTDGISPYFFWFLRVAHEMDKVPNEQGFFWHSKFERHQSICEKLCLAFADLTTYDFGRNDRPDIEGPIASILGGTVAQEIIKFASRVQQPINNFYVFDGYKFSGQAQKITYQISAEISQQGKKKKTNETSSVDYEDLTDCQIQD